MRRLADLQERSPRDVGAVGHVGVVAGGLRDEFDALYDKLHSAQDALTTTEYAGIDKELAAAHDAMADTFIALEKLERAAGGEGPLQRAGKRGMPESRERSSRRLSNLTERAAPTGKRPLLQAYNAFTQAADALHEAVREEWKIADKTPSAGALMKFSAPLDDLTTNTIYEMGKALSAYEQVSGR